jgi:hypothetical protein
MWFMLYFLIPIFVLLVWAVVYDWRRRHAPSHDIEFAARRTRSDANARRVGGGH